MLFKLSAWVDQRKNRGYVIVKPHHKEDIFVITLGRGVNNKEISYKNHAGIEAS